MSVTPTNVTVRLCRTNNRAPFWLADAEPDKTPPFCPTRRHAAPRLRLRSSRVVQEPRAAVAAGRSTGRAPEGARVPRFLKVVLALSALRVSCDGGTPGRVARPNSRIPQVVGRYVTARLSTPRVKRPCSTGMKPDANCRSSIVSSTRLAPISSSALASIAPTQK